MISNEEIELLNNYSHFNSNNDKFNFNSPIINSNVIYRTIKNKGKIDANNIIRFEYLSIDRSIFSYGLSNVNVNNNKSKIGQDLKFIHGLPHDSSTFPKSFNFKIFEQTEEINTKIRNVFEFITYRTSDIIDIQNEYSILNSRDISKYAHYNSIETNRRVVQLINIYFIGNIDYYNNINITKRSIGSTLIDNKVWLGNYNLNQIRIKDVLPITFSLIKSYFNLKLRIHDKSIICYSNTNLIRDRNNINLINNLLDNNHKNNDNIKLVFNYLTLFNNCSRYDRNINFKLYLKQNFLPKVISQGFNISKEFINTLAVNINTVKVFNSSVYINVLNTDKLKLSAHNFDHYDDPGG